MEFIDAKKIVASSKHGNWWFGADYGMNIYRGCSHGCIYCDSRSDCYRVDNFDIVRAKKDSSRMLADELSRKRKKGVIGMGAMSDPYNPLEKKYEFTRDSLSIIFENGFGVALATKSALVTRDIDILKKISKYSPVLIKMTITCADDDMGKKIEPNVSLPSERFEAIKELCDNGIFAGVLLMPVLPFLEDNEENILAIVRKAHESGAKFIYAGFGVTLRGNQRAWFYDKLDKEFPGVKEKYIKQYGEDYSCGSPNGKKLKKIFQEECKKLGILYKMKDIIWAYKEAYEEEQLNFFKL